ncbi:hypothetical protein [Niveibacterium sp. SC-1]|uniref:hypothetical protein n=1 Tax=Niveibacterium sp. SC-1 TaxID=3135646 RepID=UPI00311D75DE
MRIPIRAMRVHTTAYKALRATVRNACEMRRMSLVVRANPGVGLTTALELLGARLPDDTGLLYRKVVPVEGSMLRALFAGLISPQLPAAGMTVMLVRVARRLAKDASEEARTGVIFAVDRAHLLHPAGLEEMCSLEEALAEEGLTTFFILAGGSRLADLEREIARGGGHDILGRYWSESHRLRGIQSQEDVAVYLRAFDRPVRSDEPALANVSATESFLPTYFAQGWRYEIAAQAFWRQLAAALPDSGELPFQPVHEVACTVLESCERTQRPPVETDFARAIGNSTLPAVAQRLADGAN